MQSRHPLPVFSGLAGFLSLLSLSSAGEDSLLRVTREKAVMGTRARIVVYAKDDAVASKTMDAAFRKIEELEGIFSDYDAESEFSKIHVKATENGIPVSDTFHRLAKLSLEVAKSTGGAFDPTTGRHVRNWRVARRTGELPDEDEIAQSRECTGWKWLEISDSPKSLRFLKPGMRLDFGGIGKGFAADEALAILQKAGIDRALVAVAGDIAVSEPPPGEAGWKIQLEAIDGDKRVIRIRNAAVSTSGDRWQSATIGDTTYSHIIDPRSGLGLTVRRSVSVVAPKAVHSDSLATALSVLGNDGTAIIEKAGATAWLIVEKNEDGKIAVFKSGMNELMESSR